MTQNGGGPNARLNISVLIKCRQTARVNEFGVMYSRAWNKPQTLQRETSVCNGSKREEEGAKVRQKGRDKCHSQAECVTTYAVRVGPAAWPGPARRAKWF